MQLIQRSIYCTLIIRMEYHGTKVWCVWLCVLELEMLVRLFCFHFNRANFMDSWRFHHILARAPGRTGMTKNGMGTDVRWSFRQGVRLGQASSWIEEVIPIQQFTPARWRKPLRRFLEKESGEYNYQFI